MKTCTKCKTVKQLEEFHNTKKSKDGKAWHCKSCAQAKNRQWREANIERARALSREWNRKNKERQRENNREWRERNRDHCSSYTKKYRDENLDRLKREFKKWYEANRDKTLADSRRWNSENKERRNARARKRLKEDKKHRAYMVTRWILNSFLKRVKKGKSGRSCSTLGYTEEMLMSRMECQFQSGMSWSNHGEWHVDHKIPVAHFIAKGETRPHIVNALSNLQPMWASENFSKGAKHPSEWQAKA